MGPSDPVTRRAVLDSSVLVKWFKRGEEREEEALRLRDDVLDQRFRALVPELGPLEVCRGLVKAGLPREKVLRAHATLEEMERLGLLEVVPAGEARREVPALLCELGLFVSDALVLASSLIRRADLITEDSHLLAGRVRRFAGERGVRVLGLAELYGES